MGNCLRRSSLLAILAILGVLASACGGGASPRGRSGDATPGTSGAKQTKSLTVGITSNVQAFGLAGTTTTAGGWMSASEIHSEGLITSDTSSRKPIGRLAERPPSFDDGSMVLLPDGRLQTTYHLRSGVTWQDGSPFTARDLVFSYAVNSDTGLPFVNRDALNRIQSVDAPDDLTAVITFSEPFYLADSLGLRLFWPYPEHLLRESYEHYLTTKDAGDFVNLPYFTSGYVNLGPFRLTSFDPGEGLAFAAYDGYFLGRPKVDVVRIQPFGNENTMFANLLAGSVDIFMDLAMSPDVGFQLKDRWDATQGGTVYFTSGYVRMLIPQYRPSLQKEPGNLDPQVRRALLFALDRPALSGALQDGHTEFAANSILPPEDRNYEGARDGLAQYTFDPDRARTLLAAAGWSPGSDGVLRNNADGHRYQTSIISTPGSEKEIAAIADYWRHVGLDVEETMTPPAFTRDNQYRASYPGWETTANYADSSFGRLKDPAGPDTRWAGTNRSGYDDPRAARLVDAYYRSMSPSEQVQAIRAISDFIAAELPYMPFMLTADNIGFRKGVVALSDFSGGAGAGAPYGSYTRNAHLWDVGG